MSAVLTEVADSLRDRQKEVIERWMQACEADDAMDVVSRLTRAQFKNNLPSAIEQLSRMLLPEADATSLDRINDEVAKHGHHRWKQGFNLRQLIRDWGHLNEVLVDFIDAFFKERGLEASADRSVALGRLAQYMTEAASSSVWRFDELRHAQAASVTDDLISVKGEFERVTRARGAMLREAAHDLRGGLSSVALASDVLKGAPEASSFGDVLDTLDRGIKSVSDMLNSLLDLSRLESGADSLELLTVNVAEVFQQLVHQYRSIATEKGLSLTCSGPEELIVKTDPAKVRRIAQNLLVNALQHTTRGEVCLLWSLSADHWVLEVADTGPGIQEFAGSAIAQELDHNDRSRPTRDGSLTYRGEGIGLTIVKRLCELLDAGISLQSSPGKGARFTVELPVDYPGP